MPIFGDLEKLLPPHCVVSQLCVSGEQRSRGRTDPGGDNRTDKYKNDILMLAQRLGSLTFLCNPDYLHCTTFGENSQQVCINSLH